MVQRKGTIGRQRTTAPTFPNIRMDVLHCWKWRFFGTWPRLKPRTKRILEPINEQGSRAFSSNLLRNQLVCGSFVVALIHFFRSRIIKSQSAKQQTNLSWFWATLSCDKFTQNSTCEHVQSKSFQYQISHLHKRKSIHIRFVVLSTHDLYTKSVSSSKSFHDNLVLRNWC